MRSIYLLSLAMLGCGDNAAKPGRPDAPPRPDAAIDAPEIECHFTELADATNDDLFGGGTAEATALSFTTERIAICGQIDSGHFNTTQMNVDVDSYKLTVPANTRGILYLTAPGAENLESVSLEISGLTTTVPVSEVGVFSSSFATTSSELPPGDYLITVSSYNAADTAAPIDYKVTMLLDPETRCAKSTAAASYTEATDGATASGNDVYEVRYGSATPKRQFTLLGTDAPEPTGITVNAGTSYRVSGINSLPVSAPVSWMDAYQDRDTYQITMGAANTLAVRVNWASTTADLDFFVFPMSDINEIATGWYNANMEDEFTTMAVTAGATYWVMVAADDPSTGHPINYDITFCGSTFSPDPAAPAPQAAAPPRSRRHPVFHRDVRPLSAK